MLFIVAMSGLVGFVAGVRVRLLALTLLAALVAAAAGVGAVSLALPGWQVALSVVLAVTAFELAAFAAMSVRIGLSPAAGAAGEAPETAKPARAARSGAAALR
ncbi:hypothetical protein [Pleomorphomonas koreensis]|uniref:hypothetical protein n=1 Tax=Pleomorphomonas koreensis TaxID=257440 RepID=UPI00040A1F99|nr:hypothetical protein [Pleomorphomonas koreensis]